MSIQRYFVFHCLVVNRYYLNCFIDQLLPSIINSDNDWFFNKYKSRFLISTSQNDLKVFINSRIFQSYKNKIEFDFQIIPEKILSGTDKYSVARMMSKAHFYAADYCMKLNCYGSFLSPDMVVNSRFLEVINESIERDETACIAPAFRGTYLDNFLKEKITYTSQAPNLDLLPARLLVKTMFENMHVETQTFYFNSPEFLLNQNFNQPTAVLYKNKDGSQILGFGMSWFLCMINFSQIPRINKKRALNSLKLHTIDAFFLDRLIKGDLSNVRVIKDSNDIFVLSWDKAPMAKSVSIEFIKVQQTNFFKLEMIKLGRASGIYDITKLKLFLIPWVWNSGNRDSYINFHDYSIPTEFFSEFLDNRKINTLKQDFFIVLNNVFKILGYKFKQLGYKFKQFRFNSIGKRLKLSRQIRSSQYLGMYSFINQVKSKLFNFLFIFLKLNYYIFLKISTPFIKSLSPLNQARGGFMHAILRIYTTKNSIVLAKAILHKSSRN